MDFTLPEALRMLRDTVARFVEEELIPLEPIVIRREAERGFTDSPLIPPEAEETLTGKGARHFSVKARPLPRLHQSRAAGHRDSLATFAKEP